VVSPSAIERTSATSIATSSQTSAAPSNSTTTPGEPQLIEYYGDSTVWGYRTGTGGQVAQPAPVAFAEVLSNPSAYIVRNEGANSSTAYDLLNGTDGRHQPWSDQMAASRACYVFINHAINDQWRHDLNTYRDRLRSLAQTAKQYGKQMVFETSNPTHDSSCGLEVYINAMMEVASQENIPVIDQYQYLTAYLNGRSPTRSVPMVCIRLTRYMS
jgi:lysophospholipase L1-like esterase